MTPPINSKRGLSTNSTRPEWAMPDLPPGRAFYCTGNKRCAIKSSQCYCAKPHRLPRSGMAHSGLTVGANQ